MGFSNYFAEQLRRCLRKKIGEEYTYKEISKKTGIPEATAFGILEGHKNPNFENLELLMALTECKLCSDNVHHTLKCVKSPILANAPSKKRRKHRRKV